MVEVRRTFGPVVLVGLVGAGLAAVAASKTWVVAQESATGSTASGPGMVTASGDFGSSPLAAALALVVLATWGVVLVTRGRFRRLVAALGVIAALGFTVTTVLAPSQLRSAVEEQLNALTGSTVDDSDVTLTAWWWAALVSCGLIVATTALALRWVPSWPEMGSRYDAPTGTPRHDDAPPETNIDIWKAIDEGRDPTA